jgi:hypothetical protein
MFQREGFYYYQSNFTGYYDEGCWVFAFPEGQGHVVEISMSFETLNVMALPFTDRFIGVVAAAVGLSLRTREKFSPKPSSVILKYQPRFYPWIEEEEPVYGGNGNGNENFVNVAYDLSLANNVFVWRETKNTRQLGRLRSLTGAQSLVLLDLPQPGSPVAGSSYYASMISKGDSLVS